jgi:hypothetical protein
MSSLFNPGTGRAPSARTPRAALALAATAIGLATVLMAPAAAVAATAVKPTISVPSVYEGYGRIAITGTARPGATVNLHEAAYVYRADLAQAAEVYSPQDVITTVAGSDGRYTLSRVVDSGFVFAVEADGLMSDVKTVTVKAVAELQITTTETSTVYAKVLASPGQPYLTARVQRKSGSTWIAEAEGPTEDYGVYSVTLSDQPAGSQTYRAWISGDPANALVESSWVEATAVVGKSATTPSTPTKPTTPTTPTTPTKPTTPTTPTKPVSTAVGAVQVTKVVYNSPGTDTGSNASINGEWVRLTNKTSKTISLKNWTLRDAAGHVYTFSTDHSLGAGKNVYVLTGKGTNGKPVGYRYWGSKSYVWNNSGDTASLRDGTNKTIDTCRWTSAGKGTTYC